MKRYLSSNESGESERGSARTFYGVAHGFNRGRGHGAEEPTEFCDDLFHPPRGREIMIETIILTPAPNPRETN